MEISSKNKRILLVSDVHQEISRLEKIIKEELPDEIVVLGDWFDSHVRDDGKDVEATCEFLKQWIDKPNFRTLIGNHDVHYLYSNNAYSCSGYAPWKNDLIKKSFGNFLPFIREKFGWYIWVDDFLCTHAGIHPYHFPPRFKPTRATLSKWLDEQIKNADGMMMAGCHYWLYGAGAARGGPMNYGGIVWLDFNQEFEPIGGLKQIVGHTYSRRIRGHFSGGIIESISNVAQAENLCIDSQMNEYLIIHNGKLEVKRYADILIK